MGANIYRFVNSAGNAYVFAGANGSAYRMALPEHSHTPVTQWSEFDGNDMGSSFFSNLPTANYYVTDGYDGDAIWDLDDTRRAEELHNRYCLISIDPWGGVVLDIAVGPSNDVIQCVASESTSAIANIEPVGLLVADTGSHMVPHSNGFSDDAFNAMEAGRNVYFGIGGAYMSDYGFDLQSDIEAMTWEQFDDAVSTDSRLSNWSWVKWDGAEHCFYIY